MEQISKAIVAFQADLKPVKETAENPYFKSKYMSLPKIMTSIQPLLSKHKLAVVQMVTNINGQSALATSIIHESGEALSLDPMPLLMPKNEPQAQGSAITYARRYALCAALGIVADKDDDGNSANDTMQTEAQTKLELAQAKGKLVKLFADNKITEPGEYVNTVLGKNTIDTLEEAEQVKKSLGTK